MPRLKGSKQKAVMSSTLFNKILEDIAEGTSLRKSCEKHNVAPSMFVKFVNENEKLQEQYARARITGQDAQFDNLEDYARESKDDPYTKKLYIDVIKWKLAKQQPKKYGDKLEVEGKNIAPTTIIIKRADE